MNLPSRSAVVLRLAALSLLPTLCVLPIPGHAEGKKAKSSAASAAPAKRKVPPTAELNAIVRATLLDVDKGLETKDFTQLYEHLSPTWRKQFSKEQLTQLFAGQLEAEQRTDYVATLDPVYDPAPAFDSSGRLVLSGHYPSEPQWVLFRIKYFYEAGGWKPLGMAVRVQNSKTAPSRLPEPGEPELPPAAATASPAASPAAGASPSPAASPTAASASPSPAASASPGPQK